MAKKTEKNQTSGLSVVSQEPFDSMEDEKTEDKSLSEASAPADQRETEKASDAVQSEDASSVDKKLNESTDGVTVNNKDGKDEEPLPPKPARPVSPTTRVKNDLKEAFPNVDEETIIAILVASQGRVDPAFNALLYLSDPSFEPEVPVPVTDERELHGASPSKPSLDDDEVLARKLQKEFEKEERKRRAPRHKEHQRRKQSASTEHDSSSDDFDNFKETFSQGLEDARTTLNGWVSGLARKFDGNQQNKEDLGGSKSTKLFGALGGSSFNFNMNESDRPKRNTGFDEDPEILRNDFHEKIQLQDNEEPPSLPKRKSGDDSLNPKQSDSYDEASRKWQPLDSNAPVNPNAFIVTDSEEEENSGTNNVKTEAK